MKTYYMSKSGIMWVAQRFMDDHKDALAQLGDKQMYVAVIVPKDGSRKRDDKSVNGYTASTEERAVAKAQLALDAYDPNSYTYEILVGKLTHAILAPARYMKRAI